MQVTDRVHYLLKQKSEDKFKEQQTDSSSRGFNLFSPDGDHRNRLATIPEQEVTLHFIWDRARIEEPGLGENEIKVSIGKHTNIGLKNTDSIVRDFPDTPLGKEALYSMKQVFSLANHRREGGQRGAGIRVSADGGGTYQARLWYEIADYGIQKQRKCH